MKVLRLPRKILSLAMVLLLLFTVAIPYSVKAEDGAKSITVTKADSLLTEGADNSLIILHTNDTHARVKSDNSIIGFSRILTMSKELKEAYKNVLLVDAGDTLHGQTVASISNGESIIDMMNMMGYDLMVPGNHDFNYGQDRLVELSKKANFPILSSNIIKTDGSTLTYSSRYMIKEMNGIKVGIFGLTTPETVYKSHPKNTVGLTFEDPVKSAKAIVSELKGKVDVIIAVAHLGVEGDTPSTKVAEEVEGIDLIIDGHSHTVLAEGKTVKNTLIAQTGNYDNSLGIIRIDFKSGKILNKKASLISRTEAASEKEDEALLAKIKAIDDENKKALDTVVGKTEVELNGLRANVRTGETNMGNLIADAVREESGADVVIINGGDIRDSIKAGDITKGQIITVLPFGSTIVVKEVKGSILLQALEYGVSKYPEASGGFPHVSGMTLNFNPKKEVGSRISNVKIAGVKIDPNKTYKLAVNDFLAAGGDGYVMLKDQKEVGLYPQEDEILLNYVKKHSPINIQTDGRFKVIETEEVIEVPTEETIDTPVVTPAPVVYIVKKGDCLWKIGRAYRVNYMEIVRLNKIKNPNLIYIGQKLVIPAE